MAFNLQEFLFGTPGEFKALETMAPAQQDLFSQLLGGLGGPLQSGLGNLQSLLSGDMSAFEAPAMRQFFEQIIPGIAERFTGMGGGAQSSSAFQQALGGAGAGLAENLAMQKSGLQQQGLSQLSSLLGMGVSTPTFQWQQMPGSEGLMQPLSRSLGNFGGQAAMGAFL